MNRIENTSLTRIAEFVLRHRRPVVAFWLVLLVAGIAASGSVSKRLTFDFALPGQPGYETAQKIKHIYGNGGDQPPSILVVTVPRGESVRADAAKIGTAFAAVRRERPELRVVDYGSTHDPRFVTRDGRTTFGFAFAPQPKGFGLPVESKRATAALRARLPMSFSITATGLQELANSKDQSGPGVFAETMLGALGALAVLAFVFASLLALVPLLIAAFAILTTFLVVLGLTYVGDISFVVQFLIALVGLGVAIDYSLLIVTRWREERAHERSNHDAVVVATATAGRAVLVSGLTVAIGLVALIVLPEPAMRSIGVGGMLIPLSAVAVSLTLLPALLGGIGPRVDWPHRQRESRASRAWVAWARLVVRRKWIAAGAGAAVLGVLMIPAFSLTTGETSPEALAKGQAKRAPGKRPASSEATPKRG